MTDPHGDPIPPATGSYIEQWSQRLDSVEPGTPFRVDRVDDRVGAALRHPAGIGVRPGVTVEVLERTPFGVRCGWVSTGTDTPSATCSPR